MSQNNSQCDLEIVRRLGQAASARKLPTQSQEDLVEYDWTVPSHFTRQEMAKLNEFAARLSDKISEALGALLRIEAQVQLASVAEHYATQLQPTEQESADYCVELIGQNSQSCGFMVLAADKAFGWVAQLLGGQGSSSATERDMSSLESAVLLDIFSALANTLSETLKAAGGSDLNSGKEVFKGNCGLDQSGDEEYCKISFQEPDSQDQLCIRLVILSSFLETLSGSDSAKGTGGSSADDIRKDMLEHLKRVPVVAEAYLGKAFVKVRHITDLQPGDVLLTEGRVDEPISIFVQGNKVLSAFAVISEGQYALRVASAVGA